jgi:hypothetical protein
VSSPAGWVTSRAFWVAKSYSITWLLSPRSATKARRRLSGDQARSLSAPAVSVIRWAWPPSLAGAANTSPWAITASFLPSGESAIDR